MQFKPTRFQFALLLGSIGIFSLAGCTQPQAANTPDNTSSSTTSISPAPSAATTEAAALQTEYAPLLSVVSNTRSAVEANDFAKAQQEFDQFEGVWSQVEDGIKAKASASYDAIEQDMDQVNASLKGSDTDKALAALQALQDHIQSIPKS